MPTLAKWLTRGGGLQNQGLWDTLDNTIVPRVRILFVFLTIAGENLWS